jgi:hypothetical protein
MQDHTIVVGVYVVAVAVPIGGVDVKLDVTGQKLSRLGRDHAVAEVRPGPATGPSRIDDPQGRAILGVQPSREDRRILPQDREGPLRRPRIIPPGSPDRR